MAAVAGRSFNDNSHTYISETHGAASATSFSHHAQGSLPCVEPSAPAGGRAFFRNSARHSALARLRERQAGRQNEDMDGEGEPPTEGPCLLPHPPTKQKNSSSGRPQPFYFNSASRDPAEVSSKDLFLLFQTSREAATTAESLRPSRPPASTQGRSVIAALKQVRDDEAKRRSRVAEVRAEGDRRSLLEEERVQAASSSSNTSDSNETADVASASDVAEQEQEQRTEPQKTSCAVRQWLLQQRSQGDKGDAVRTEDPHTAKSPCCLTEAACTDNPTALNAVGRSFIEDTTDEEASQSMKDRRKSLSSDPDGQDSLSMASTASTFRPARSSSSSPPHGCTSPSDDDGLDDMLLFDQRDNLTSSPAMAQNFTASDEGSEECVHDSFHSEQLADEKSFGNGPNSVHHSQETRAFDGSPTHCPPIEEVGVEQVDIEHNDPEQSEPKVFVESDCSNVQQPGTSGILEPVEVSQMMSNQNMDVCPCSELVHEDCLSPAACRPVSRWGSRGDTHDACAAASKFEHIDIDMDFSEAFFGGWDSLQERQPKSSRPCEPSRFGLPVKDGKYALPPCDAAVALGIADDLDLEIYDWDGSSDSCNDLFTNGFEPPGEMELCDQRLASRDLYVILEEDGLRASFSESSHHGESVARGACLSDVHGEATEPEGDSWHQHCDDTEAESLLLADIEHHLCDKLGVEDGIFDAGCQLDAASATDEICSFNGVPSPEVTSVSHVPFEKPVDSQPNHATLCTGSTECLKVSSLNHAAIDHTTFAEQPRPELVKDDEPHKIVLSHSPVGAKVQTSGAMEAHGGTVCDLLAQGETSLPQVMHEQHLEVDLALAGASSSRVATDENECLLGAATAKDVTGPRPISLSTNGAEAAHTGERSALAVEDEECRAAVCIQYAYRHYCKSRSARPASVPATRPASADESRRVSVVNAAKALAAFRAQAQRDEEWAAALRVQTRWRGHSVRRRFIAQRILTPTLGDIGGEPVRVRSSSLRSMKSTHGSCSEQASSKRDVSPRRDGDEVHRPSRPRLKKSGKSAVGFGSSAPRPSSVGRRRCVSELLSQETEHRNRLPKLPPVARGHSQTSAVAGSDRDGTSPRFQRGDAEMGFRGASTARVHEPQNGSSSSSRCSSAGKEGGVGPNFLEKSASGGRGGVSTSRRARTADGPANVKSLRKPLLAVTAAGKGAGRQRLGTPRLEGPRDVAAAAESAQACLQCSLSPGLGSASPRRTWG